MNPVRNYIKSNNTINFVRNSIIGQHSTKSKISNGMNRRDFLKKCAGVAAGPAILDRVMPAFGGFVLSNPAFEIYTGTKIPNIVILFGWDGAQRNHVKQCLVRGELPNLKKMGSEGAFVEIDIIGGKTDTKAGWAEILTGYDPEVTGVFSNSEYQPIPKGLTVFERLEKHFGPDNFVTLAVIGKGANVGGGPGLPYYYTKENMDLFEDSVGPDSVVGPRAIELIEKYKGRRIFFFVHFRDVDSNGHKYGENSQEYTDALISNDYWTGRIIRKLKELGLYDSSLVYVTADHGFNEGQTGHSDAPYVFLGTNDRAVICNGERADITPTILDRFGLDLSKLDPPLDGRPLTKPL